MRVYLGLKTSALARSLDYGVQRCRAGSSEPRQHIDTLYVR
jgi:hypothetical protein